MSKDPRQTKPKSDRRSRQRAVLVGAVTEEDDLSELAELLTTARVEPLGVITQKRPSPHPNLYVGPGKVEEIKALVRELGANVVATDDELTPRQERNLEAALGCAVIDRTAIILDIFAAHAHTAEGKLQVELAQLQYNLARMRGLWTHLERLGGGIGTRGPGESQIETDRRLARDRISALKRRLDQVASSRETMRHERERSALPNIAIAGYTNAGKSTLLNHLTGADIGVRDRLFHTLDPTTRTWQNRGRTLLITDTVGFIRKLPHALVDAFAATLEETKRADLILHVVDASAPADEIEALIDAVESVLDEIGAVEIPQILVWNKIDRIDESDRSGLPRLFGRDRVYAGEVLLSAAKGEGIEELEQLVLDTLDRSAVSVDLLIPFDQGSALSDLHRFAGALEREDTPEGVRLRGRLARPAAERYERFNQAHRDERSL